MLKSFIRYRMLILFILIMFSTLVIYQYLFAGLISWMKIAFLVIILLWIIYLWECKSSKLSRIHNKKIIIITLLAASFTLIPNAFISSWYTKKVLTEAADKINLPADFKFQTKMIRGSDLCLDDCTQMLVKYKTTNIYLDDARNKLFNGLLKSGFFEYEYIRNGITKSCIYSNEGDYCLKIKIDNLLLEANIVMDASTDGSGTNLDIFIHK